MATDGLVGVHGRRKWRKGRHPKMVPAPDLLQRDFTAERSDLRWVADITEFACEDGKLFLAGDPRPARPHASSAGRWVNARPPTSSSPRWSWLSVGASPSGELVHHADHGSQYTSLEFTNRLADWKLERVLRQRRRRVRQRRDGSVLGDAQEGDPPHLGTRRGASPAARCARSCSTTSRSSTTAHATRSASATAPPPRPTLPAGQPDLSKPRVHEIVATPRPARPGAIRQPGSSRRTSTATSRASRAGRSRNCPAVARDIRGGGGRQQGACCASSTRSPDQRSGPTTP